MGESLEAIRVEYESVKAEVERIGREQIRWRVRNPGVENADLNYAQSRAYKKFLKASAALEGAEKHG